MNLKVNTSEGIGVSYKQVLALARCLKVLAPVTCILILKAQKRKRGCKQGVQYLSVSTSEPSGTLVLDPYE